MENFPLISAQARTAPEPAILFAVTDRERNLFFSSPEGVLQPASCRWLEESHLEAGSWEALLEDCAPEILVTGWSTPPLPVEWLCRDSNRLRYVCHLAGSVRAIVPRVFIERGGLVTNWGGRVAFSVAEHALLLALALLRNASAWRPFIESDPAFRPPAMDALGTRSLAGRAVGIHGFGAIARELVKLLRPFKVSIAAYSEGVPDSTYSEFGVRRVRSLEELFSQSQVLFECEALTEETRGRVDGPMLRRLPDGALFVNVGRGSLVDEAELVREASSRRIRVASDVAIWEPLTAQAPLSSIEGAVLSPHIGGPTLDDCEGCGSHACQNISRYLGGHLPEGALSLAQYDRMT